MAKQYQWDRPLLPEFKLLHRTSKPQRGWLQKSVAQEVIDQSPAIKALCQQLHSLPHLLLSGVRQFHVFAAATIIATLPVRIFCAQSEIFFVRPRVQLDV